jgi:hypothetical protein
VDGHAPIAFTLTDPSWEPYVIEISVLGLIW